MPVVERHAMYGSFDAEQLRGEPQVKDFVRRARLAPDQVFDPLGGPG